ncbi:DUF4349 domain-containing protein [Actinoplanes derwentensis]|uniref:DUF4349 domain-containing protein n=1 Tax=Actinoplanes derwentensis TaxID=113562 RepID=A0A1H2D1J3_9ACTN|nr:DUF4349 domain-containing protein [Actinoplanes derwentensis]GID85798.1 lipoprotein [Actinoplanes derwentensis]SDT76429.1 protein of unknown function [Actinoplanes derwentensis]
MDKRGITAALLACLMLAGCGADNSDSGMSSQAEPAVGQQDTAGGAAENKAAPEQAAGQDTPAQAPNLQVDQRSIIYTGSITIRVDDVTAASAQVTGIATGSGGFVSGDERHSGTGSATANIQLRIPAAKFSSVVDQLGKLGKEESRGINTEDVTEQVVDLDARISVQKARVESGKRLLAEAKSLNDLVMLEREVATRESDLASLEAKKRRLDDLTALSTITVVLLDPEAVRDDSDDEPVGFLAGLSGGWQALLISMGVLLTVLGALLPWAVAIGVPVWAVIQGVRRYRRRSTPAPTAP